MRIWRPPFEVSLGLLVLLGVALFIVLAPSPEIHPTAQQVQDSNSKRAGLTQNKPATQKPTEPIRYEPKSQENSQSKFNEEWTTSDDGLTTYRDFEMRGVSEPLRSRASKLGFDRVTAMKTARVGLGKMISIGIYDWVLFPAGRHDFLVHFHLPGELHNPETEERLPDVATGYVIRGNIAKEVFRIELSVGQLFSNPSKVRTVASLREYLVYRDTKVVRATGDYEKFLDEPTEFVEYFFEIMTDYFDVTYLPTLESESLRGAMNSTGYAAVPIVGDELEFLSKSAK